MPMTDYFNPSSFKPAIDPGSAPNGFIAGGQFNQDRDRYNGLMDLFQAKQQAEMQDYMLNAPVREATRRGTIASQNALADTVGGLKKAELEKSTLANDLERGTLQSKIAQKLAESKGAVRKEEWDSGMQDLQKAAAWQGIADNDPGYQQTGQLPMSITSQLDPKKPFDAMILQAGPQAGQLLKHLSMLDPKTIQKMAEDKQHWDAEAKKQAATDASHLEGTKYTANAQLQGHREANALTARRMDEQKKWESRIMELQKKSSAEEAGIKGSITKAEAIELNAMYARDFSNRQAGAGVGAGTTNAFVPNQGVPVPKPVQVPIPGGQQPVQGSKAFATEAEASAANLPSGTLITIGGRPARVK